MDKGAKILRILDGDALKISVALWVYLPEYEDWRLVLSSRKLGLWSPPVMILGMSDPFIRNLRRIFGKAKSVDGMRLGGQTIGDRFVDDAYPNRMS